MKPHSKPFLVTTVYRPPSSLPTFFDDLEKLIKAIDNENKEMYILGDLNCNMLKTDKDANIPTKKIKSLYELYQLTQMIDEATRVTMATSSLIDQKFQILVSFTQVLVIIAWYLRSEKFLLLTNKKIFLKLGT